MFQNGHVWRISQNIGTLDILKREFHFYLYNPNKHSLHNRDQLKHTHIVMYDLF